jgi:hypothetical protein
MDGDSGAAHGRGAAVKAAVENMLRVNPEVKSAFHAMHGRGLSRQAAKDEIARALLGCMWEASNKYPR